MDQTQTPREAMLGAIGWRQVSIMQSHTSLCHEASECFSLRSRVDGTRRLPSDVALNDELYPRTFGAVWPSSSFPYAEFLESNFEVFLQELQSILAEEPCCF